MFKTLIISLCIVYCNSQLITKNVGLTRVVGGGPVLLGGGQVLLGGGGLVRGGYLGSGYLGGGYLGGGLINGGLVNGGLINGGLVNGGLINGGLVNGGLVGGYGGRIFIGGLPAPVAAPVAVAAPVVAKAVGPIPAAIQSYYTQQVLPVQTIQEPVQPQIIDVEPASQPVVVHFRSQSSPVQVEQSHIPGAPGEVQITRSEDEPHRVIHEVVRPVIQEVREVIQPYRRITQEIRPVEEEIHSIVARGEGIQGQIIAAPAPVAIAAPAPVAVEAVAAPVAAAIAPITTQILRQPIGLIGGQKLVGAGLIRKYVEYP